MNVLTACGAPELTAHLCAIDDLLYGDLPGISWERTKTLGRGDDRCDFRFCRVRADRALRPHGDQALICSRCHGEQEGSMQTESDLMQILQAISAASPEQPATLEEASSRIGKLFAQHAMPDDIAGVIRQARMPGLGGGDVPVAVRSSATAEDLPEMSFAGQQETYLNIRGEAMVLDAIKRCWAKGPSPAPGRRHRPACSGQAASHSPCAALRKSAAERTVVRAAAAAATAAPISCALGMRQPGPSQQACQPVIAGRGESGAQVRQARLDRPEPDPASTFGRGQMRQGAAERAEHGRARRRGRRVGLRAQQPGRPGAGAGRRA